MSTQDPLPDFDPLADLDADAPPEFRCPITMSIMKDPVIMPDGQTYERTAIESALKANPISPLTRQPMSMSEAKTNYALKSLIEKYIQDHKHEINDKPEIIDPTKMVQISPAHQQIPITTFKELQLDTFKGQYSEDSMLIRIKPDTIPGRLPVSIIALIDISGSMNCDASLSAPGAENASFSRNQLVQYSLKTIVSILGESDRITLITFSDRAKVMIESLLLDEPGKKKANNIIDHLHPNGSTNIWDALDKGIDQAIKEKALIDQYHLKDSTDQQLNTSILLFTDGEPNINPPIGIVPTLRDKLEDLKKCHFSISTFGFGYEIDSDLLLEIAEIGNGVYGYCPDVTMVGTIFINYLSNLISMVAPLAVLRVDDKEFNVALYNGTSTNLMVKITDKKPPEDIQINLTLPLTNQVILIKEIIKLEDDQNELNFFRDQKYRKELIDLITESKHSGTENSSQKVIELYDQIKSENNRSQFMNNLMIDLYNDDEKHGQIERAYRKVYYSKWGRNYVYSLLRFHVLEQCGNFKDLSLQLYGNDVFRQVRKIGNKIFMNLPIPQRKQKSSSHAHSSSMLRRSSINLMQTQSITSPRGRARHDDDDDDDDRNGGNYAKSHTAISRRQTMRSFCLTSVSICFNGEALIDLWGGSKKEVKLLKKGDMLSNGAKVICLIRCATDNGYSDAVKLGDALFTPYHPVKVHITGEKGKSWIFPIEAGCPQKVKIDYWYNMIIDHDNSPVVIGGIETVTLGHNMKNDVCYHPYFGSQKVVDALKKYDGFKTGFLEFKDPPTPKRDPITNMVMECF